MTTLISIIYAVSELSWKVEVAHKVLFATGLCKVSGSLTDDINVHEPLTSIERLICFPDSPKNF